MEKYTTYCTLEQTKKALELGAPLKEVMSKYNAKLASQNIADGKKSLEEYARENIAIISSKYSAKALSIPTAEQMISWLDDNSLQVTIRFRGNSWYYDIMSNYNVLSIGKDVSTRKEATLAAIDAALEYLVDNNLIK